MLLLDYTQVQYCQVKGPNKTLSGLIYNGNTFIKAKSFAKEELEAAIKECREEYLDHPERTNIPTLLIKEKDSVGIWMQDNRYKLDGTAVATPADQVIESKSNLDTSRISIRQLALQMRSPESGLEIKTRRYKIKLYHRCFLGNEAIDWIVKQSKVSRSDALLIGQKMIDKKIFHHLVDEHGFKDEPLFYRFYEDEGKSIWTDKLV
jgi:hypothetical protein